VLRSGTGQWFIDRNGNRQWDGCATDGCYVGFGTPGDFPVAGDWSGSGFAKIGVFRSGQWYLDNGNGAWDGCSTELCLSFGQTGDLPVAGNWDGGLKAGVGVFRAGTWYLDYNGNGAWDGCQQDGGQDLCLYGSFGQVGDLPAAGDWNGDGKAKVGVFRNGTWYLDYNLVSGLQRQWRMGRLRRGSLLLRQLRSARRFAGRRQVVDLFFRGVFVQFLSREGGPCPLSPCRSLRFLFSTQHQRQIVQRFFAQARQLGRDHHGPAERQFRQQR